MSSRFALRALLAAVGLAILAVPALAEDLPQVIRFGGVGQGFGKPYGTGLIAIAQEKGFVADQFKGTPVKLEWTFFTGTGPAINEAFANGQLDLAQYGSIPQIIARANGVETRIILGGGGANIYAVARVGLPVKSLKDLKGRSITFQKGTILHWAALKALAANGLSPRDVRIVDLHTPDQRAALAAGQVDASFGSSMILPLQAQGIVKVIYSSKGTPQAIGPNALIVTDSFQKKYPDATARVVRGFLEAAKWLAESGHQAEAIDIWAKSGVPRAVLQEDASGSAYRDQFNPRLDAFFRWQYGDSIAFEKDQKIIRNDVDLSKWIEPKYQDAALAALKLKDFWPTRSAAGVPIN